MEYKILTDRHASGLNAKVAEHIAKGFKPVGDHKVVEVIHQNQFSGMQHQRTLIESEYSQTMIKDE